MEQGWERPRGTWPHRGLEPTPPRGCALLPASFPQAVALPDPTAPACPHSFWRGWFAATWMPMLPASSDPS